MQRLRTVTLLDVSAVAGHHAMPAALLFLLEKYEMSIYWPACIALVTIKVNNFPGQHNISKMGSTLKEFLIGKQNISFKIWCHWGRGKTEMLKITNKDPHGFRFV